MADVLIPVGIVLGLVFLFNLARARSMRPDMSAIRLVPAAAFLTEAFIFRIISIVLFAIGIPLMIFTIIGSMMRPR